MHITPIKISIAIFVTLFLKKLLFPQWISEYQDFNTIEFLLLITSVIYIIIFVIRAAIIKK